MEAPPENKLLADLELIGKVIAAIVSVCTVVFGAVFRRRVWRVLKSVGAWMKSAVMLPVILADIQSQLRMKDGRGFSVWAENVDHSLVGVRRMLAMETALRRAGMQNLAEAIFEADMNGKFLWVNRAFQLDASCSLDDVRGDNWQNIVLLRDRDDFVEAWKRQITDGNNFRGKFRLNTEAEQWMSFDATCNRDELGQVIGYLGYMRMTRDPRIHQTDN